MAHSSQLCYPSWALNLWNGGGASTLHNDQCQGPVAASIDIFPYPSHITSVGCRPSIVVHLICKEESVRQYWAYCGDIESLDLMRFPDTGRFRGIAFITFATVRSATVLDVPPFFRTICGPCHAALADFTAAGWFILLFAVNGRSFVQREQLVKWRVERVLSESIR